MKEYKLSQLLEIKNGKDHKELPDGEYPVFGSGGVMRFVTSIFMINQVYCYLVKGLWIIFSIAMFLFGQLIHYIIPL